MTTDFSILSGDQVVPANVGVYVIEGNLTANDAGNSISATQFNYLKPREYDYTISGDAKIATLIY
jgi:hypothetical protein